jgi:diguanylate cyclase (GGDEF)-like protein
MVKLIAEERGFAAAVVDALSSHICVIDKDGLIIAVNRAWQNFAINNPPVSNRTGVGAHYLQVCRDASGPGSEDAEKFALGVRSVLNGKSRFFEMEYPCHGPTQIRWFLARVTPLKIEQGGAVISHATITKRKLLELKLERLAATDALTALPNRRYFIEAANLEVERVRRFGTAAAVVMIDLDNFKVVNDTYGHAVGDEVIRSLSRVCKRNLRKIDTLARMGGEEFVIMLPGTDESAARGVAEKLRQMVVKTPIRSGRTELRMTASFGVAEVFVADKSIDECVARADLALYAAKRSGRNRVANFAALPHEVQQSESSRRVAPINRIMRDSDLAPAYRKR